jgi:uncharacterized protein YndB with AHSA1/START domain
MTNDLKLEIARIFDAPRELVWKAWTEAVQIKQWMYGDDGMTVESVKVDLRIGGKFRIQMKAKDGEFFTAVGTYLQVKAHERLVYTWDWEKDGGGTEFGELEGNESQVTVEFHAPGKRTELVLTHERFASVESRNRHKAGWQTLLANLGKFVERIDKND